MMSGAEAGAGPFAASLERLLAWERQLLQAASLGQWLECLAAPQPETRGTVVRLLLADPTHEMRPLLAGSDGPAGTAVVLDFVTSIAGLTPHLLSVHGAWRGDFHAADHALLFPGEAGLRHLLLLPLCRGEHVVGCCNIGARGELPPFAGVDARLLDHAADVIVATLERHLDRARVLRSGLVDPLTGWHSPRYLQARLREEIARAQREQGSVACLVADVDRLQLLNDALGQSAGDRVLRELAARIESQVRASDAAARLGSDAFVVITPGIEAARAAPLAERILAAVRSGPIEAAVGDWRDVRVSIGIADIRPQPGQDRKTIADQVLADAVAALHRAKQAGGDRYEILSAG